ncbi:hypothetical protein [Pluralibacter gergoviae]|uniref:hypothetical protein n=1 Tax=Pluralibacter gergoviae TaxID=61647 RepID=UPI0012D46042|nr:hypothetical protein [Pluralibacter gergoviae]
MTSKARNIICAAGFIVPLAGDKAQTQEIAMRIEVSRRGEIYFLLVSQIKLSVAQDLDARFGDRVINAAFGTDITSMGLAPGDELVSAGYHLHNLNTAVFVTLHHAIGADTPVVIFKG